MNYNIPAVLLLFTMLVSCRSAVSDPEPLTRKPGKAKIVFKSADGGQTWQDISKGLPEDLQEDSIRGNFFANDEGLFLRVKNGVYHNPSEVTAPFWKRELSPNEHSSIPPGNSGLYKWGVNLEKANGMSVWSPIFESAREMRMRSVFETANGAIFMSTDGGLWKTGDEGNNWKRVHIQGMDGNMAEQNGILTAISMRKMIRSTGNGECWGLMSSEDAFSWDMKPISSTYLLPAR